LGLLRRLWASDQINQDERSEIGLFAQLAEAIGAWSNPEYYYKVKKKESGLDYVASGSFRIEHDTSDFDRRVNKAVAGEVEIHEQRLDFAEKIQAKRTERKKAELAAALEDPRIKDPFLGQDPTTNRLRQEHEGDDLEIIYREPEK